MRTLILAFLLSTIASAQTITHVVTLTWADTANPAGTTYNIYRATGLCSGTPTFNKIGSAVTAKTFDDNSVSPGNWCYQVTAVFGGAESVPSNSVNPNVPAFAPTSLTFTVK